MVESIDREALLDRLEYLIREMDLDLNNDFDDGFRIGLERAMHEIELRPAADVRPVVRGRWIEFPAALAYKDAYCDTHIVCSACEAVFDIMDNCTETFNFCPNCGADMRGGADGIH